MELLQAQRVLQPPASSGSLDSTPPAGGNLEALEESPNPRARTPETRRCPRLCTDNRMCPQRPLAYEQGQVGEHRSAGYLLFFTRFIVPLDVILPGISRTAQYGPVCCVVWEGGVVRLLPIPINHIHKIRGSQPPQPQLPNPDQRIHGIMLPDDHGIDHARGIGYRY